MKHIIFFPYQTPFHFLFFFFLLAYDRIPLVTWGAGER